jgi:uroporphyrinogen-III decarboxylase
MIVSPETRERLDRALRASKEQPDFVPILAQINEHVVKLCGGDMREAYTSAEKFVEMNLAVFQYYHLDLPGFYYDIYNIEAEALGQRMNWEPHRMPDIDRQNPLIREHSDLDHLRPPDFKKSARMPFVLEVMRRCYDLGIPVRIRFCSPFSLAVNVRGIEALLMDTLTGPKFAHRLLTFLTEEVLIPWVQTQREAIGQSETSGNGADAAASPPIVTVEILQEFVMPYVARMNEKIGNVTSMGYWGYSYLYKHPQKFRKMLELMVWVSPRLLMCLDPDVAQTGPEPYVEFARERNMPLMLGLDTILFQEGPIGNIVERCRRYVLAGVKAPRLAIFFNDISVNTPVEHVHAAIAAVRHFGKYPVVERPLESFRMPEIESFDSFNRRCQQPVSLL